VSKLSGTVSQFEQTANMKFMCKVGRSVAEMLQGLETVFGDYALKNSCVLLVQLL
jgi:hypothetical protein